MTTMIPWETIITGAVGIGGTALGAWIASSSQTRNLELSINSENERTRNAEKRRVYVSCITALGNAIEVMGRVHAYTEVDTDIPERLFAEYSAATSSLLTAISELILIASNDTGKLARRIYGILIDLDDKDDDGAKKFRAIREELFRSMRADLGEPI